MNGWPESNIRSKPTTLIRRFYNLQFSGAWVARAIVGGLVFAVAM